MLLLLAGASLIDLYSTFVLAFALSDVAAAVRCVAD
jgi:hypothetical protein